MQLTYFLSTEMTVACLLVMVPEWNLMTSDLIVGGGSNMAFKTMLRLTINKTGLLCKNIRHKIDFPSTIFDAEEVYACFAPFCNFRFIHFEGRRVKKSPETSNMMR